MSDTITKTLSLDPLHPLHAFRRMLAEALVAGVVGAAVLAALVMGVVLFV